MTAEDEEQEEGALPDNTAITKNRVFSKLSRELSESDLSNPSIGRMLLSKIDNLEARNDYLSSYEKSFHEKDKEVIRLTEKIRKDTAGELLSQLCLALGGGLLSVSTLDFSNPVKINNYIFLIFGLLLIIGSLFSYWGRR